MKKPIRPDTDVPLAEPDGVIAIIHCPTCDATVATVASSLDGPTYRAPVPLADDGGKNRLRQDRDPFTRQPNDYHVVTHVLGNRQIDVPDLLPAYCDADRQRLIVSTRDLIAGLAHKTRTALLKFQASTE